MLLRRAVDLFLEGYFSTCERSPKTISAYTSDLEQFRRGQPPRRHLERITPEALEAWALELKGRELAPASIKRKFAVLRVFFNYWVRKRVLERSPLWNLRLDYGRQRTLTRTISPAEMRRLLEQVKQDCDDELPPTSAELSSRRFLALRNWAILELLFATGMRVGEAAGLLLPDLMLDQRAILVRGKGGRQRLAFLTDNRAFKVLHTYQAHRHRIPADTQALFLNTLLRPISAQGIASMLRKQAAAASISRHLTPHMIRHTAATFLLQNGADLRVVQEFLGHASITTTQRYTHVTQLHLQATLQRCHPGLTLGR